MRASAIASFPTPGPMLGVGKEKLAPLATVGKGLAPEATPPEEEGEDSQPAYRFYVQSSLFLICSVIFCWYWTAFPLTDVRFTHEYTQPGIPPGPGPFSSARYGWEWWHVWLLGLNWLLPYLWGMALLNNFYGEYARLHYFVSRLTLLTNFWTFIFFSVSWIFVCNNGLVPYATACNDLRWCCVYFPSTWCPNIVPCTPNVTPGELTRTDAFFQMWLFSLLFVLWGLAHRSLNGRMREMGLFKD